MCHETDRSNIDGLIEMSQLWLNTHVATFQDAIKYIPLEELGKQARPPLNDRQTLTCPRFHYWNVVRIENVGHVP